MNYPRHRAITTRHKGFAFRSRLEARWSIFFDHLGIRWDYEPEGFELGNGLRYLPDFWLPDFNLWIEIKPDAPDAVTHEKATRLLEVTKHPIYVTCGMPDRNGVFFFLDHDQKVKALPAYAYFGGKHAGVLTFGDTHSVNSSPHCAPLWVHEMPFDQERADAGARLRPPFEDALFAARGARFEFGAKGAM